jgi:hypothetical protein
MNPEHEMLVDKLKGHTYNLTPHQYLEVRGHMDAEMMYIIESEAYEYVKEVRKTADNMWRPYFLFSMIAVSVIKVMCERENFTSDISFIKKGRIVDKMLEAKNSVGVYNDIIQAAHDFLIYAVADTLLQIRYYKGS